MEGFLQASMDLKTTSIATDNTLIRILVNIENLEGETIMGMARIYEEDIDFKMLFNSLNILQSAENFRGSLLFVCSLSICVEENRLNLPLLSSPERYADIGTEFFLNGLQFLFFIKRY